MSSSVIKVGQTAPSEASTSAKGGSPANVGSDGSFTIGGFTTESIQIPSLQLRA